MLNVTQATGSGVALSANLELLSVMREMVTDILNTPTMTNGFVDSRNSTIFKNETAYDGIVRKYGMIGGGLFERTAEFENFKTDAIRTTPSIVFTDEKMTKRIPISWEAANYSDLPKNMGIITTAFTDMAKMALVTINEICASVYLNSFVTLGADGVPMLAATALTGTTHPGFGDNVFGAAVPGTLSQTDIEEAITALEIMPNRAGQEGGFDPIAVLTTIEGFSTVNTVLDSKTIIGQDNPGVVSYVSNYYGLPVHRMRKIKAANVANMPDGYTNIAWILSSEHSVFKAEAHPLETWVQGYKETSNAETNLMGIIHYIAGFYDGLGITAVVW